MKKYSEYKDSGIEWIGEIPSHWVLPKIGIHIDLINGYPFDSKKFDYSKGTPLVRIRDITKGNTTTYYNGDYLSESIIYDDDILVGMDGDFLCRWWLGGKALLNQRCCCLRPLDLLNKRLLYYLLQYPLNVINDLTYFTTVKHLSSLQVKDIRFPLPPLSEQQAIADFLDDKTAKIDRLLSIKRKQIELLKEQRTAVINNAVTKGLNPNAPMKDSGIYWLGSIPKSWSLKKFSYCTSIRSGQVDPTVEPYCDMPLIAPNHIESKTGRVLGIETAKEQGADSGKYLFEEGEVLYSKIRPHLQKVCTAPVDGICSADMYAIRPIDGLLNTFLAYFMLTEVFTAYTIDKSMRVAIPKINREDLTKSFIAFPNKLEQEAIVKFIKNEEAKINQFVEKAKHQIEFLTEYKTALISEAVTGKINVVNF